MLARDRADGSCQMPPAAQQPCEVQVHLVLAGQGRRGVPAPEEQRGKVRERTGTRRRATRGRGRISSCAASTRWSLRKLHHVYCVC